MLCFSHLNPSKQLETFQNYSIVSINNSNLNRGITLICPSDIDECSPENRDANCAPDFTDCTNYALNVDNKRYTCECSPGNQGDPNPPSQGCEEKPRNCSHAIAEDIVSPSEEEFLPTGLFLDISDDPASPQFEEIEVCVNCLMKTTLFCCLYFCALFHWISYMYYAQPLSLVK